MMTDTRWAEPRTQRDADRERITTAAMRSVGGLSKREVLLLGAAIYWCEGQKTKAWRPNASVTFINSDPCLIQLFVRFAVQLGYKREELSYRLSIHESADLQRAYEWWREQIGLSGELLNRATLKRHNPVTVRHNAGDDYHGCLVVYVPKGMRFYWRMEGIMAGLAKAVDRSRT